MAKKMVLAIIAAMVVAGAVNAQEADSGQTWWNSYAPGIDQKVLINAGVGFGFSAYQMGIPPISVSADFKLPIALPITLGGTVAFRTSTDNYYGSGDYSIDITYIDIAFGVRGAWHFNFLKNFDTYAGVTLGYVIQTAEVKYGDAYGSGYKPSYDGVSYFLYGVNVGGRYFFTKNIGAYLELGYSGLQIASLGLTVKF